METCCITRCFPSDITSLSAKQVKPLGCTALRNNTLIRALPYCLMGSANTGPSPCRQCRHNKRAAPLLQRLCSVKYHALCHTTGQHHRQTLNQVLGLVHCLVQRLQLPRETDLYCVDDVMLCQGAVLDCSTFTPGSEERAVGSRGRMNLLVILQRWLSPVLQKQKSKGKNAVIQGWPACSTHATNNMGILCV